MNELHIDHIKAALQAERQDDEALSLYWNFIEVESAEDPLPYSSERFRQLLIEAYRLLYTAWQTQPELHPFDALVDSDCQRRFSVDGQAHPHRSVLSPVSGCRRLFPI